MRRATFPLRLPGAAALTLLAACADGAVLTPPRTEAPPALALLECVASVPGRTVRCQPASASASGTHANLILGGQGTYVRLASGGAGYDSATSIFRMDVTVQNLLGQPIGTTDGATAEPEGIRVFFADGPHATQGAGTVEVENEDGSGVFLGAQQPFFRYVQRLTTGQASTAHEWRFSVPHDVTQFRFGVYVSAPVPDQQALARIDTDPRTVAAGGAHACAIDGGGQAWCWGAATDGQLGGAASDSVPRPVAGGHHWRTLSAGAFHTCGITTGNAAYCWGDDEYGQLGDAGEGDGAVPVPVAGGRSWLQMDAGEFHTCGVTTDYAAYCWGHGTYGELGGGDSASATTPVLVQGGHQWAMVDAGAAHSCGVTRGGAAYCWGKGDNGSLGTPSAVSTGRPVLVAGDHSWRSVSADFEFSCGVTSRGAALCWGYDYYYLGNGDGGFSNTPMPVAGGREWVRVQAGRSVCGITTGGQGYCWGPNDLGGVGDGTTTAREVPTAVSGGLLWSQIEGGTYHTCGVSQDGVAHCWGNNLYGQLGDNTTREKLTPVIVSGGRTWAQ